MYFPHELKISLIIGNVTVLLYIFILLFVPSVPVLYVYQSIILFGKFGTIMSLTGTALRFTLSHCHATIIIVNNCDSHNAGKLPLGFPALFL